jgi:hypothetical protein
VRLEEAAKAVFKGTVDAEAWESKAENADFHTDNSRNTHPKTHNLAATHMI